MYYFTDKVEMAIQCVAGNIAGGHNVARLGKNVPESWDYELRMRDAKTELGLKAYEKMNTSLAREYVYNHLKEEDLPEPVVKWKKEIAKIEAQMEIFNNFMNQVALGKTFKKSVLVGRIKRFFPSVKIEKNDTVAKLLEKIN